MAQPTFQVRIITPEKVFFEGPSLGLVAPGSEGYLGILSGHAPLVTPLVKGTVTLKSESNQNTFFEIDEGFLEVSQNQVLILAENIKSKDAAPNSLN
jgi:F-type H+-transporting ATPase subunit epsilon